MVQDVVSVVLPVKWVRMFIRKCSYGRRSFLFMVNGKGNVLKV